MYTIFKDYTFAAAHSIRGHQGKCRFLHGHNYRVRVHIQASELDEIGMVLDFSDLKRILEEILGPLDHRLINEIPPFDERNTTAELMSYWIYEEVSRRLEAPRLEVARVEVWENDTACATFEPARGDR